MDNELKTYEFKVVVNGENPDSAWDEFLMDVTSWHEGLSGCYKPDYDQVTETRN